jgi:flagellar motor switch protein FliM
MDLETAKPEAEVLSQAEIERVLAQVAQEESQTLILKSDGTKDRWPKHLVAGHDFRAPAFLAPNLWRRLRREHQDFAESLAGRLSSYLRLDTAVRVAGLERTPYRDFIPTLAEPTHLALFKLEPLRGICLLEMHPHLGLSMVDRLMGGPGQAASLSRDLTEIEVVLLDQALGVILDEWCLAWAKLQDLRPAILGHESTGRYLQTAAADALMLVVVLETRLGNCLEEVKLAFPCATLEGLFRQLEPVLEPAPKNAPAPPAAKAKWNPDFNSVAVPLAAAWPARQLSARQITQLKVGDVLEWDLPAASQVVLRIAQSQKFIGQLGTKAGRWAVEITALPSHPANSA